MEKEVSEVDRKLLLKKTYLDKINYHLTRDPINQDELYLLIRRFFGEYLKLDYEFTYEELSQELNKVFIRPKVKEHIDNFLIRLSESEYLEETSLDSNSINSLLKELADIIMNMISEEQSSVIEDSSILHKLLGAKHKDTKLDNLSGINSMIDELNFHISSGNLDSSKRLYVDILKIYDNLKKDEKKKLHDPMNEVYERLQLLMKNPHANIVSDQEQPIKRQELSDTGKDVMNLSDETAFYINALNVSAAKEHYNSTLKLYDTLKSNERKILHLRLNELYEQLQSLLAKEKSAQAEASKYSSLTDAETSKDALSASGDSSMPGLPELPTNLASNTGIDKLPTLNIDGTETMSNPMSDSTPMIDSTGNFMYGDIGGPAVPGDASGFDFSLDVSSADTQSSQDEDVDVYRRPILEDNDQISELNKLIGERLSGNVSSEVSKAKPDKKSDVKKGSKSKSSILDQQESTGLDSKKSQSSNNILFSVPSTLPDADMPLTDPMTMPSVDSSIAKPVMPGMSSVVQPIMKGSNSKTAKEEVVRPKKPLAVKTVKKSSKTDASSKTDILSKTDTSAHHDRLVTKLMNILTKVNDDIVMEKFDKAKESYKEALLLYRSMKDSDKAVCYGKFYSTFKSLDKTLHQRSLHNVLDKHLSASENSQRPMTSKRFRDSESYVPEANAVSKNTTLPMVINTDEETTRVYELIEEAYFNMDKDNHDLAMLKYFKALELYHSLPAADKKAAYHSLYELFKKLSMLKDVIKND